MSRFRIVIQRIDDDHPQRVTELDAIEVPALDARCLQRETALDQLETGTLACGQEVMRHLLVRQWEQIDAQLGEHFQEFFPPVAREEGRSRSPEGRQSVGHPVAAPPGVRRGRRPPPPGQ